MGRFNAEMDVPRQVDENVLKTIRWLHLTRGHAYVPEVAESLGMVLTTTYKVVRRLADRGEVVPMTRGPGQQSVVLTPLGQERAQKILDRHETIKYWFIRLGVPEEEADEEACHMEHGLTDNTMAILKRHVAMASRGAHAGATAEEIMERHKKAPHPHPPGGMTLTEEACQVVERLGGLEGARRKLELMDRVAGSTPLEDYLELTEELGGTDAAAKRLRDAEQLMERYGSVESIRKKMELLEQLGGLEGVSKLKEAADKAGGVKPMLKLVNSSYNIWKQALDRER